MDQQKIGTFISECRKEKGLTQAQFAEKLGVSDKSVSRWENGRTMPDMSLYEDICGILGVQVSELLYARRMEDQEKITQGERSALGIFKTRSALETFGIFTEILIFVGIIITITLTRVLAETPSQMVITMICGCFVWSFGIVLRVKIRKAIMELEKTDA
ncbi:MAG: helix-turn-helix transcriptional regulator [Firmicutes bacterium]|nr:helix-turn-helix transcriptional regulator [Bacillota bacterium]